MQELINLKIINNIIEFRLAYTVINSNNNIGLMFINRKLIKVKRRYSNNTIIFIGIHTNKGKKYKHLFNKDIHP